ncbi:MAG: sodium:proton antiporter [Coriobacteriia bacterium]|nr:sodium:proton antiporter [Coriobacteriia bacterium]
MHTFEYILVLLAAVLLSNLIGQFVPRISLPLIQVALGVACVFLPLPFHSGGLDPELFLVLFIAPMLFEEAKKADKPSLWRLRRPILSLAVGLVFATCLLVGTSMHLLLPTVPLAAGMAIAAALSPTDAVAVLSLKGIATITEEQDHLLMGEALLNDAASIVSFQFAIAYVMTASFSLVNASVSFIFMFFGGLVLGLVLMGLRYLIMRAVAASGMELTTFFVLFEVITPSLIYLIAELLHVSGIIAVVAAGVAYSYSPRGINPLTARNNVVSSSVWAVVSFTINGLCFLMLGAQLPSIVDRIQMADRVDLSYLFVCMFALLAVVVVIRFVWVLVIHRHVNLAGGGMSMSWEAEGSEAVLSLVDDGFGTVDPENQPFTIDFHLSEEELQATTFKERQEIIRRVRQERRRARKEMERTERAQAHADLNYWKLHLRDALLLTIAGPKGAITLALVFAIPMVISDGSGFPERDIITFVSSGTILISLLFTSFSMPILSPKAAVSLDIEDEIRGKTDILRSVIFEIQEKTLPEDRAIADIVIGQYIQRIQQLLVSNNQDNPEETRLRLQALDWERQYVLGLIANGKVSFPIGAVFLSQLCRQQSRLEQRSLILLEVGALKDQLSSHYNHWRSSRKSAEYDRSQNGSALRMRFSALQIEAHEHSIAKLEELLLEVEDAGGSDQLSELEITRLITVNQRQIERMTRRNHARTQILTGTAANQAQREQREMQLTASALEWEREAITDALRAEKISHHTAKQMLDSVAIMELDIEEVLE